MCYLRLSPDNILIENENFQYNVLLLSNIKPTIFFASLQNIVFADTTFVLRGLGVLLFFGRKLFRSGFHGICYVYVSF